MEEGDMTEVYVAPVGSVYEADFGTPWEKVDWQVARWDAEFKSGHISTPYGCGASKSFWKLSSSRNIENWKRID